MKQTLAVVALLLGLAAVAHARKLPEDPDEPDNLPAPAPVEEVAGPPVERVVSLTVSPFHALIPFFELTAEMRIGRHFSGSVLGGIGKFLDVRGHPHGAREIGAQGSYYLEPTFRAFHFGVEATYVHSSDTESATTFTGTSLAVGAFVGWKYIHRTGITLLAQGGLALGVVEVRSPPGNELKILPLINLNAGWSF